MINISEEIYHALYKYGRHRHFRFRDLLDSQSRYRLDRIMQVTWDVRLVSFPAESLLEEND